ncbi:hypothetical protein NDR87_17380 [Nocardia sp. CDC159]|uniref:Glutamine amidotransferase domain-containing protein n=1 Tax=Nocardia pulmonis TaxID=2951408 RepID=A0A9X2ED54_9NOCA|nr:MULTISPECIES: hypothetical protein [Nocardia]MCM6775891.1 hypothetical protein [Nocardia pulmonis]MCM6788133.1 hypothetical protein [Nocardia sp. CDC159]
MIAPRVLIIDNGSLSIAALRRRFESLGLGTEVVPCAEAPARIGEYQALVLSGTKIPADVGDYSRIVDLFTDSHTPTLGVCGGMHIIALAYGARLTRGKQRIGNHKVELDPRDSVLGGAPSTVSLFQRHTRYVGEVPAGFRKIGWAPDCPVEVIRSDDGRIVGSQAHLEFRPDGFALIARFARFAGLLPAEGSRS